MCPVAWHEGGQRGPARVLRAGHGAGAAERWARGSGVHADHRDPAASPACRTGHCRGYRRRTGTVPTLWLASLGYQVEHRDLMPLHVEQLTADAAEVPGIHTAVGDVRDLDLPDASVTPSCCSGRSTISPTGQNGCVRCRSARGSSGRAGRCSRPRSRGGRPGASGRFRAGSRRLRRFRSRRSVRPRGAARSSPPSWSPRLDQRRPTAARPPRPGFARGLRGAGPSPRRGPAGQPPLRRRPAVR